MTNLLKKIVAVATSVSFAVMLVGPGVAQGATIEELLASIAALEAELAKLQSQLTTLQAGETPPTVSGCTITSFTRNLKQGMSGDDVKCLQIVLNSATDTQVAASGVGSSGNETKYFGPLTKAGVIKFQEKYADEVLASWGLTKGTGFVGSTSRAKLNSLLTTAEEPPVDEEEPPVDEEEPPVEEVGFEEGLKAALADDNPAAMSVAKAAYDKVFAKIKFTAGTAGGYTITSVTIHRSGLADDNDIAEVKIYDGATQLGTTQALNVTTYKATFSSLSWEIPAGTSKVLTIKGTLGSATNATAGNAPKLGIALAADVVTSEDVTVEGVPLYGNAMTIAGTSVGQLDVDANAAPAAGDVISGATDQLVASFKFNASATEGFDVQEIVLTEIGTSVSADVSNITLKYLSTVLATVDALDANDQAVFSGSPILSVAAGSSKNIDVYVDISSGVISERTIRFEVTEAANVTAVGKNTGGIVLITSNSGSTYSTERGAAQTIKQGDLTVALDTATNPSATNYAIGSTQVPIVSFKFSAGANEGVKVTKFKIKKTTGIDDNEISSVQLYIDSASESTGHVGSISSNVVTFADGDGLFTVPKSGNTVVTVKCDITTAADDADVINMYIGVAGTDEANITMKGVDSDAKIYSDTAHLTLSSVDTGDVNDQTVKVMGSLTVTDDPNTPASKNLTVGQTDVELARFKLSAEWEDMLVSSVKVRFWEDADPTTTAADDATDAGEIRNARLYLSSVATANLLDSVSTVTGYANFSTNFTVSKDAAKTLCVVVDIPTTSGVSYLTGTLGQYTGYTSAGVASTSDEITTTGQSSAKSIYETGGAEGNTFTLQTPTLAVTAATTPPNQQVVTNSTETWIARMQLAGAYEDIKVTSVTVTFDDASGIAGSSSAEDVFTNIKLKKGTTQIGATKQMTDGGGTGSTDIAKFIGIDNLTVGKDQTVSLDVYADVSATSTDTANLTWYIGHLTAGDIVGSGIDSNTSVSSSGAAQASKGTVVRSSGLLTVAVDANTPIATNHAVGLSGKSGVEFSKMKFEATYEDMKVTTLKLTLIDSGGAGAGSNATTTAASFDFDVIYLYDGATQLASAPMTDSNVTFTNDTGLFTVPSGGSKVITVKADVFGIATGAHSGDSPILYLANVSETEQLRGLGASSNTSTTATVTTGGKTPQTYTNFKAQWLYKTIITVAKNAASPSGSATAGAGAEVLRFDVTADSNADAVLNAVALTVSGSADVSSSASGHAYLYKSTDLVNALAEEADKTAVTLEGGSATATTATTTQGGWDGIPTGATVHILDSDGSTWRTAVVDYISDESAAGVSSLNFSAATDANIGDKIYYQPLQPGSGKLFFGAMTKLNADVAQADTSVTVDSTDGFASGDTVNLYGYGATGTTATTSEDLVVSTTTDTVLYFDGNTGVTIDYNRNVNDDEDTIEDRGIAYTSANANAVEETIAKGTTKTFVVKGDTTGAASTKTIRADIAAVGDLKWDDKEQHMINARTTIIPVTGGTLTY